MTVIDYRAAVLNHVNSLTAVHKSSTPETWPGLRDAYLEKIGMTELSHLEY